MIKKSIIFSFLLLALMLNCSDLNLQQLKAQKSVAVKKYNSPIRFLKKKCQQVKDKWQGLHEKDKEAFVVCLITGLVLYVGYLQSKKLEQHFNKKMRNYLVEAVRSGYSNEYREYLFDIVKNDPECKVLFNKDYLNRVLNIDRLACHDYLNKYFK